MEWKHLSGQDKFLVGVMAGMFLLSIYLSRGLWYACFGLTYVPIKLVTWWGRFLTAWDKMNNLEQD